jgi:hypothetical protein
MAHGAWGKISFKAFKSWKTGRVENRESTLMDANEG